MRDVFKALVIVFVIVIVLVGVPCFFVARIGTEKKEWHEYYISYNQIHSLLEEGVEVYKTNNGVWPADMEQLVNSNMNVSSHTRDGYGRAIILIPYSEKTGYGALVSYGKDGKPGGDNKYDRDIEIRFPKDTETNAQWNKQIVREVWRYNYNVWRYNTNR
jgi:hypothetical protein